VESLSRVSRSQRYLDIGAMVPLSRVLSIGPRVVPASLFAAMKSTASPTIRLLATLGGNVCAPGAEHTCLTALAALEAHLELRSAGATRLIGASQFWSGGAAYALRPGELLARVRLPIEELSVEVFAERTIPWGGRQARVSVAAVAAVYKDAVEVIRLCLATPWLGTLRFGDFESACSGVRLPMRERVLTELLSLLRGAVVQRLGVPMTEAEPLLDPLMRETEHMLRRLSRGEIERIEGTGR
jgi:CO/xanthine dehydrogenase FAD-binding subunit